MLKNDDFYTILKELVEFGISRYERDYSDCYENSDLVLYQKYTYEEVGRLMNWEKNLSSVMNGYMLDKKTKTYPVFINYDKSNDISDTSTALELFCSLAERLDDIKHYIDHGLEEHNGVINFVHGKVYSDIF